MVEEEQIKEGTEETTETKEETREFKKDKIKKEGKDIAYPAKVLKMVGIVGGKQSCIQVRCKVLSGRDEGKIMRRNVLGPVKIGDILLLRETEMSASRLRGIGGRKA